MSDDNFLRNEAENALEETPLPDDLLNEIDSALSELTVAPVTEVPEEAESPVPDDLLSEIDSALSELTVAPVTEIPEEAEPPVLRPEGLSDDPGIRDMQEIFLAMARAVLRPIDRYIKALSLDEEARELLELSDIMISPLISKTEAVGLKEHTEDLVLFRSLLLFALGERDASAFRAMKKVVGRGFDKLQRRFEFESLRGSRPAVKNVVIFYRALRNDSAIGTDDVRRLFTVGIPSITWIRRSSVEELASLSGIETAIMRKMQKIAHTYRFRAVPQEPKTLAEDALTPIPKEGGQAPVADDGFDSEVLIDTTSLADAIYPVR